MPYVYKRRLLEPQYGIHNDSNIVKMGDSAVVVDTDGDITIKEREFRGCVCLWELLTRNNENKRHVTPDDLQT
jgi:hypothetical protein